MFRKKHKYEREEAPREKAGNGIGLVIPFFLAMAVLTVVSFLIPLRPTQSYSEKRNLAEFPEFSVEALASGSYFDDITTWFSDTFPGREGWINLSSYITSFHGYSEIAIQGEMAESEMLSALPEVLEIMEAENEQAPEETETGSEETEPTEETEAGWGGVKAGENEINKTGAVIQIGNSAFSTLGFSEIQSDRYIKTLSTFADDMAEKGVRVVSAPCPTAIGIMVEKEYMEMLRSVDQNVTLGYMHGGMSENVLTVNTVEALIPHNNEYIYFRTDHHWTALGAYYSYREVCNALGYTPAELESFEEWDQGEFKGSLYGKVKRPHQLEMDNVMAYIPEGDIDMLVYNNSTKGYEMPLLQDTTKRALTAKYLTFLSSDNPMCEITNHSMPDGPSCVVIKDSYGNCFAPFLTQNYHKVYAIDYRKFSMMKLRDLVDKYEIDDVIFIPYMTATQSSLGNDLFKSLCRN